MGCRRRLYVALHLSISVSSSGIGDTAGCDSEAMLSAARVKQEEEAQELLRQAVAEKAAAVEARTQARWHAEVELAEQELVSAKQMRR